MQPTNIQSFASRITRLVRDVDLTNDLNPTDSGSRNHDNATAPDYSSGLAGVNLSMDRTLITILAGSFAAVIFCVLAMRLYHLYTADQRRIQCLHADKTEQNFWAYDSEWWLPWLKREVIYAPLGSKRHNREWQLGKAVNYGTLPSRAHTFLLGLLIISNLIYMAILPYGRQSMAKTLAELRGRAGMLAVVNMIPLVVLAGRNNPLIKLVRISFDNYNLFHRWIGRIVVVESLVHVAAWYANYSAKHGTGASFGSLFQNVFLTSGFASICGMIFILFQSLSMVRHAFYEVFLHGHQIMAFITMGGIYVHLDVEKLPALPYAKMVIMSWVIERILRLVWIVWLNIGWRHGETTKVIIEALPGEACRVTFQLPRHTFIRPGSHVYAYLPRFSAWMSHPFSVAWTNVESEPPTGPMFADMDDSTEEASLLNKEIIDQAVNGPPALKSPNYLERGSTTMYLRKRQKPPTSLSLICAARTGMTRTIYEAAKNAPNRTIFTNGFIEGAYAGHEDLGSYGTVVMFAGGAGITHHLVQIRHLIAAAHARTVATHKIVLCWSVKDLEALTWVAPWMDEILKMPGRRDILSMRLFVTKPRGPADYQSPSRSIELKGERCQPAVILDQVLRRAPSDGGRVGACFVSVCGPGAFADEVRAAVRERLWCGGLEMNEESFTW